jgi:Asp-tRNA(Asn)/Glu-tRNA(Gln) amidotransferase A subunit family amidase
MNTLRPWLSIGAGAAAAGMLCFAAPPAPAAEPASAPAARVFDLQTATIADINAAFDAGALTSERLVELYLARIEAYDKQGPRINAVITLNPAALETARALDAERRATGPRSPLHGVPVVLKDLYDTADLPTTAGFLPMKDSQPIHDATVVKRLREAGAIVLAKVNMSDWFGVPKKGDQSTVLGRTSNPYNLELTPGGSSGGTGASLAAAFAQVGMGSETGVSIRNPTSNNSIVGLAPTRGLIPRAGQVMTSFTQERAGPMARSVYDVAVLTDAVAGFDAEDLLTIVAPGNMPTQSYASFLDRDGLRGARIGVFRDLFRQGPKHAEGIALVERAIAQMKEAGAVIVDPVSTGIDLFPLLEDTRTNYYEAQFSYDLYFRRLGPDAVIHDVHELIEKGGNLVKPSIARAVDEFDSLTHHPDFLARRDTQETLKAAVVELMDKYRLDALVYPFKSLPPERHLDENVREKDNPLSSVTGLPALLVPAGYTRAENGPIAVEILGRPFSEPTLFKLAYAYEQVSHNRKPPATTPTLPGERFTY